MHKDLPEDTLVKTHERIAPTITLFSGYVEEACSEVLEGVACLSCGDQDTFWLSYLQISGHGFDDGFEFRYACETTNAAVCKASRKRCVRKGRNLTQKQTTGMTETSMPPSDNARAPNCAKCGKTAIQLGPGTKMKVCGGCRLRVYCSRECQEAEWKQHKQQCLGERKKAEATAHQM